jgi:hypothetical protein
LKIIQNKYKIFNIGLKLERDFVLRKILGVFVLSIILFTFIGCDNSDGKGVFLMYVPTIHWNDTDYTVTSDIVSAEDIGEQINTIKKIVKKYPKNNCEANSKIEVGTKLYRIKSENITEAIAIEHNNKYLKAVIISRTEK